MGLKKLSLIPLLILVHVSFVTAQEPVCVMKAADLPLIPELRGFALGMPLAQIAARLPKVRINRADEFGFTALNIFPEYETGIDKAAFDGVRSISLEFLDGRVSSLWIGYDKTFKWQAIDEFASGITDALKLPKSWRARFRTRVMACADFSLAVIPVGASASIKLIDETARASLDKRKAEKDAAQPVTSAPR